MKRLLQILTITGASLVIFASSPVWAVELLDPACQAAPNSVACLESKRSQTPTDNSIYGPNGILTKATRIISIVLGVAAVIMVIIGGFQYSLASGNPKSVDNAKNTILFALIGLIIAALAQGIVIFVLNKL